MHHSTTQYQMFLLCAFEEEEKKLKGIKQLENKKKNLHLTREGKISSMKHKKENFYYYNERKRYEGSLLKSIQKKLRKAVGKFSCQIIIFIKIKVAFCHIKA